MFVIIIILSNNKILVIGFIYPTYLLLSLLLLDIIKEQFLTFH